MKTPSVTDYQNHPLNRILSVSDLVSTDLVLGPHTEPHLHLHENAFELCYCIRGTTVISKDGSTINLSRGECMLIAPDTVHSSNAIGDDDLALFIAFACKGDCLYFLTNEIFEVNSELESLLDTIVKELTGAYELNDGNLRLFNFTLREDMPIGAEQIIACCLEQFFILLMRSVTMAKGKVILSSELEKAKENYLAEGIMKYIHEHISTPLSVNDIVNSFHYSRSRIFEIFKSSTGYSIGRYITLQQISLAKQLLLEGEYSAAKVSEMTGFTSPQYFSRKFCKEVGCPPSEYNELYKNNNTERTK